MPILSTISLDSEGTLAARRNQPMQDHTLAFSNWYEAAEMALEMGDPVARDEALQHARAFLGQALHRMPSDLRMRNVYAHLHDTPDLPREYRCRGIARASLGDTKGAVADALTAIRLEPSRRGHRIFYAAATLLNGDLKRARTAYLEICEEDPRVPISWVGLSLLDTSGNALRYLDEAARLRPGCAHILVLRAERLKENGDRAAALQSLFEAAALRPKDISLTLKAIDEEISLGLNERAVAHVGCALDVFPGALELRMCRARALSNMRKYEAATGECLRIAHNSSPRDPLFGTCLATLSTIAINRCHFQLAEHYASRALSSGHDTCMVEASLARGWAYLHTDRMQQGLEDAMRAVSLGGWTPSTCACVFECAFFSGNDRLAFQSAQSWHNASPDACPASLAMALALCAANRHAEAKPFVDNALSQAPDYPRGHLIRAATYEAAGDCARSKETMATACALATSAEDRRDIHRIATRLHLPLPTKEADTLFEP